MPRNDLNEFYNYDNKDYNNKGGNDSHTILSFISML